MSGQAMNLNDCFPHAAARLLIQIKAHITSRMLSWFYTCYYLFLKPYIVSQQNYIKDLRISYKPKCFVHPSDLSFPGHISPQMEIVLLISEPHSYEMHFQRILGHLNLCLLSKQAIKHTLQYICYFLQWSINRYVELYVYAHSCVFLCVGMYISMNIYKTILWILGLFSTVCTSLSLFWKVLCRFSSLL